jgi:hypothetical protein
LNSKTIQTLELETKLKAAEQQIAALETEKHGFQQQIVSVCAALSINPPAWHNPLPSVTELEDLIDTPCEQARIDGPNSYIVVDDEPEIEIEEIEDEPVFLEVKDEPVFVAFHQSEV